MFTSEQSVQEVEVGVWKGVRGSWEWWGMRLCNNLHIPKQPCNSEYRFPGEEEKGSTEQTVLWCILYVKVQN